MKRKPSNAEQQLLNLCLESERKSSDFYYQQLSLLIGLLLVFTLFFSLKILPFLLFLTGALVWFVVAMIQRMKQEEQEKMQFMNHYLQKKNTSHGVWEPLVPCMDVRAETYIRKNFFFKKEPSNKRESKRDFWIFIWSIRYLCKKKPKNKEKTTKKRAFFYKKMKKPYRFQLKISIFLESLID